MTKEMAIQLLKSEGVWLTAEGKKLLEQMVKEGNKEVVSVVSTNSKV